MIPKNTEQRLQKILARAGVASRRAAETMIADGRVRVNGKVVSELGAKADTQKDTVEVDGIGVLRAEPLVYIALHKPVHVVSTVHDPEGRTTVLQLLEQSRAMGSRQCEGELPRVYPVGRLDFDAEGLMLLTNDGDMAQAMLHPRNHVPKTYMVKVRGRPDARALQRLRTGLRMRNDDGTWSRPTAPAEVSVAKEGNTNTWLELTIAEGPQPPGQADVRGHRSFFDPTYPHRLRRYPAGHASAGRLDLLRCQGSRLVAQLVWAKTLPRFLTRSSGQTARQMISMRLRQKRMKVASIHPHQRVSEQTYQDLPPREKIDGRHLSPVTRAGSGVS